MRIIYKVDSKGKDRMWAAEVHGKNIHVWHGLVNGNPIQDITVCKAKNIGRANETTPEEQAIQEHAALYTKKLTRGGYTEVQGEEASTVFPTLARDYSLVAHQLKEETMVWLSPKLDGVRAIWLPGTNKFQSRKGVVYNVPHLEEAMSKSTTILDGELYIHGMPLNKIVSAVKRPKPLSAELEFRVFDEVSDHPFRERAHAYHRQVKLLDHELINAVPQEAWALEGIKTCHDAFVQDGYEGVMIRRNSAMGYEAGIRSSNLYKYKEFMEDEFEIVDVKRDKQGQGVMICKIKKQTFDCRCRGTDAVRYHQAEHPDRCIGKMLTVRYFTLTEYGKPQYPVGIIIRDY